MLKTFFLNNKYVILLIVSFLILVLFFHIFNNEKIKVSSNTYKLYDLKDGDIIPFNSSLQGEFNLRMKYDINKKKSYFITSKYLKDSYVKVYYCKSRDCVKNGKYDIGKKLFSVGNSTLFDYNVLDYKTIFNKDNNDYIGWEIYFAPYEYINNLFYGIYYDIVLIPTSSTSNECLNSAKNYGISNRYNILDKSDSFKIDSNNFYLDYNTKGYIDIKFSAKKNDEIIFDLNTTSNTLKFVLNDKDISNELGISDNRDYLRYNTKIVNINDTGDYILHIEEDTINQDNNTFDRKVNIKNFTIFTPSNEMSADTFYVSCRYDTIIGKVK